MNQGSRRDTPCDELLAKGARRPSAACSVCTAYILALAELRGCVAPPARAPALQRVRRAVHSHSPHGPGRFPSAQDWAKQLDYQEAQRRQWEEAEAAAKEGRKQEGKGFLSLTSKARALGVLGA